jgi:hypothetical protein
MNNGNSPRPKLNRHQGGIGNNIIKDKVFQLSNLAGAPPNFNQFSQQYGIRRYDP